jgi:hypothetical protein
VHSLRLAHTHVCVRMSMVASARTHTRTRLVAAVCDPVQVKQARGACGLVVVRSLVLRPFKSDVSYVSTFRNRSPPGGCVGGPGAGAGRGQANTALQGPVCRRPIEHSKIRSAVSTWQLAMLT